MYIYYNNKKLNIITAAPNRWPALLGSHRRKGNLKQAKSDWLIYTFPFPQATLANLISCGPEAKLS